MNKIRLYTRLQSGIETWLIWGWQFTELIPNSPLFSFRNNNNNTKTHICTHHHSAAKRWVHSEIPAPFFTFYRFISGWENKAMRSALPALHTLPGERSTSVGSSAGSPPTHRTTPPSCPAFSSQTWSHLQPHERGCCWSHQRAAPLLLLDLEQQPPHRWKSGAWLGFCFSSGVQVPGGVQKKPKVRHKEQHWALKPSWLCLVGVWESCRQRPGSQEKQKPANDRALFSCP